MQKNLYKSVGNPNNILHTVGNIVVFNIFRKLEIFIFIQNNGFSSSFKKPRIKNLHRMPHKTHKLIIIVTEFF